MHFDRTRKYYALPAFVVVVALSSLAACASGTAQSAQATLSTVQVQVAGHKVVAELANTSISRQIGLMNRSEMENSSGMLFVFERSETQCMWMKNTLIDLDVAFADESGMILNVAQMKAGTTDIHCSKGNAKLALEMNRDWFSKRGIGDGAQITVPAAATATQ